MVCHIVPYFYHICSHMYPYFCHIFSLVSHMLPYPMFPYLFIYVPYFPRCYHTFTTYFPYVTKMSHCFTRCLPYVYLPLVDIYIYRFIYWLIDLFIYHGLPYVYHNSTKFPIQNIHFFWPSPSISSCRARCSASATCACARFKAFTRTCARCFEVMGR